MSFAELKAFDFASSQCTLWVLSGPNGSISEPAKYAAKWAQLSGSAQNFFRGIAAAQLAPVDETLAYNVLAANTENNVLQVQAQGENFAALRSLTSTPDQAKRVLDEKELSRKSFYVARFVHNDEIVLAVRKIGTLWSSSRTKTKANLFLRIESFLLRRKKSCKCQGTLISIFSRTMHSYLIKFISSQSYVIIGSIRNYFTKCALIPAS